jgi:hypothetical protein
MGKPTVIEAVRRFLPVYLSGNPPLSAEQRRAIWAMQACRTGELGGHVHGCETCRELPPHYEYHSCNHKACPLCGRGATQQWVQRQEEKRINAPHFMVTFTVPEELRPLFFGQTAKQAFGMLFDGSSHALSGAMERNRQLRATKTGFTTVLHTWNQQMLFHPHVHVIVPGAGLDAKGHYRQVKSAQFLVHVPALKAAFRRRFRELMAEAGWQCDPAVWRKDWAVNIQPFGDGASAIKYLGAYVGRSVIGDSRILSITDTHVTFRWKDRANHNAERISSIEGTEFVKRYLRHVLPQGMHSVRSYGFHHPTAKKTRVKVMLMSGKPVELSTLQKAAVPEKSDKPARLRAPLCPCCNQPMKLIGKAAPTWIGLKHQTQLAARAPPS